MTQEKLDKANYSEQNGYYSSNIDIFFNNEKVLGVICEEKLDY